MRIGIGFGLAFLPIFLCEDLKLIEKHGKDAHLDLRPSFERFAAAGALLVSESGIHEASDIVKLRDAGYSAFLVGEHLMKSGDPEACLKRLAGA